MGLISDTHITAKRGKLPEKVIEEFKDVDLIIHAGDITQQKVIDELEAMAPVVAVLGNNDKLDLNETEVIEVENFKIGINHGTDCSDDFDKLNELASKLKVNVLITGHTHKPHCEVIDDILFINPGSSNRPIKSDASIAVLDISEAHQKAGDIKIQFMEL